MKKYTPRMTDEQRAAMIARFPETRTEVLADEFGVCYRTVCRWAVWLGLKKTQRFRMAASAAARTACMKRYYGEPPKPWQSQITDNEAFVREHFATTMNGVLAELLGVNERTIRRWSQDLGLEKDMSIIYPKRYSMKTKTQTKGQAIPADIYEQLERLAYQVIIRLCENRLEQLDSVTVEDVMQTIDEKPAGKIIELYKQGVTIADIRKRLGVTANSIYKYLRKNGIEPHRVKDMTKKPKEKTPTDTAREIVKE